MQLWKRLQATLVRLGIAGIIIAFIAGIVAAAYFAAVFPDWTGFGPPLLDPQGKELPHAKTLWDWLGLLLVPLVLAIGGFFLTRSENRYALDLQERREKEAQKLEDQRTVEARKIEEQRIVEARKIEEKRAQDAALQAYLDQMTQLLLHEDLRSSQPDAEVRSVARARTLTVLRVLDGVRKATLLQFLYEAHLIGGFTIELAFEASRLRGLNVREVDDEFKVAVIVNLQGADLSGAELSSARLFGACLSGADLSGANLSWADLEGSDLNKTNLKGSNLNGASLNRASLFEANLFEADLSGARLFETYLRDTYIECANLTEANLEGADLYRVYLKGANLSQSNITREQLEEARSLEGATLPFDMAPLPAPEIEVAAQEDQAEEERIVKP